MYPLLVRLFVRLFHFQSFEFALRDLSNVMEQAALALIDIVTERSVSDDKDDDEII